MNHHKVQLEKAIQHVINDKFSRYEYCNFVKKRKQEAKSICLYGAGKFYKDYVQNINKYDFICDKNPKMWGKKINGHTCISPNELYELKSVVVFVMVGDYFEAIDELKKHHVEAYFFGDLFLNVYDEYYNAEWFQKNEKNMISALDLFEDEISKQIYVNVICNRIAPQYAYKSFHQMETPGEYFGTDILFLNNEEYYVDAGAYNGDSIQAFIEKTKGSFKQIYGFELDPENFKELKNNQCIIDERIKLFPFGLSCKEKIERLVANGTGSHIEKSGQRYVMLKSLDNILKNKRITMIKMDIEGAETEGLEGAEHIISSQHPKLAISVYHKLDHMWKVPQYIKNIYSGYKIYLRHHTAVVWDTDCYAKVE